MSSIGQLAGKIFDLLKDTDEEDKKKVLDAVSLLCGLATSTSTRTDENSDVDSNAATKNDTAESELDAAKYFSEKKPASKTEMLAVAARFFELKNKAESLESKDFSTIFSEARQNFDAKNFSQDMKNAKKQGFFVKSASKSREHKLSYNGQNYVDVLPDKAEAKKKLSIAPRRKKATKKNA